MLTDLVKYIKRIRLELIKRGYPKLLVEEITQIAIENWVDTADPGLNREQIFKAITLSVAKIKINPN